MTDGPDVPLRLPPADLIHLTPDVWTEPFWAAAAEHRLVVPRCTRCGTFRFPPCVLTGSSPSGQRIMPSATNGPPSPISQNP